MVFAIKLYYQEIFFPNLSELVCSIEHNLMITTVCYLYIKHECVFVVASPSLQKPKILANFDGQIGEWLWVRVFKMTDLGVQPWWGPRASLGLSGEDDLVVRPRDKEPLCWHHPRVAVSVPHRYLLRVDQWAEPTKWIASATFWFKTWILFFWNWAAGVACIFLRLILCLLLHLLLFSPNLRPVFSPCL